MGEADDDDDVAVVGNVKPAAYRSDKGPDTPVVGSPPKVWSKPRDSDVCSVM